MRLLKPIQPKHAPTRGARSAERSVAVMMSLILFAAWIAFVLLPVSAEAGDWRNHQASMLGKKGKISTLEGEIHELIHHKKSTENPDEIQHITKSIAEKYAELEKTSHEYREESLHIRFKHPEKGDESERKYPRYTLKSLDEMESEFGLDAKLDRIKEKIQVTYGTKKPETEETSGEEQSKMREPAQAKPAEADERIRLSR